jgi:hypothetical protein
VFLAGGTLLAIAVTFLIIVMVLSLAHGSEHRRYRAVINTPTTPIAQVGGEGLVALQGRALAGDEGLVTSPVSGRQVIAYDIEVKEWHGSQQRGGTHRAVRTLSTRHGFWLDDGSGNHVWINPQGATLLMPTVSYAASAGEVIGGLPETVHVWTPQLEAWARHESRGSTRRLKVTTREIESGTNLRAIGWASRNGGVMCMRSDHPGAELVLSTLTEMQLTGLLGKRLLVRNAMAGIGCSLAVVSVALMIIGIAMWN